MTPVSNFHIINIYCMEIEFYLNKAHHSKVWDKIAKKIVFNEGEGRAKWPPIRLITPGFERADAVYYDPTVYY